MRNNPLKKILSDKKYPAAFPIDKLSKEQIISNLESVTERDNEMKKYIEKLKEEIEIFEEFIIKQ